MGAEAQTRVRLTTNYPYKNNRTISTHPPSAVRPSTALGRWHALAGRTALAFR